MKQILNSLFENYTLTKAQAKDTLTEIASGKHNNSQVASFLTIFRMRSITVDELEGFRDAMLELCLPLDLKEFDAVDLCGTGGDNKDTFNISTLTSFVTAGAGVKVAKHGNYGVSSVCGSSNVLEFLGLKFTNDKDILRKQIDTSGFCYLHAPLFHPAMKHVAPIRKELGIKTFFNILGPMVNPSFPKKQIVGVFNLDLARLYSYLYQKSDIRYMIIHSIDGYDEVSLTSAFKMISKDKEQLIEPEDMHLNFVQPEELKGGKTVEDSAKIFTAILQGEGSNAQNDAVIANAALAIHCAKPEVSLQDAVLAARESLESKKALQSLQKLLSINQ